MKKAFRKAALAAAIAGLFGGGAGTASAAGFALAEQSGSGLGNAYAGAAASAEDASTVFFNPAGMSRLQGRQFAVAGHVIAVSADFSGSATGPAALGLGTVPGTGDPGQTSFVPNGYFVMPYGERLHFGIGVNVPFGLTTEYDSNWVGRFQGIKSELTTININPSVSYKLSDTVSVGGGINYQLADAELTNAVVLGAGVSGNTKLEADDDGWGWNLGLLFDVASGTRIGLAYRSPIEYELEGSVNTTTAAGAPVAAASGPARADVTFPGMFSLSLAHRLSDRLQLLGDATFTQWSEINRVDVVNTTNGTLREVFVFDFDDSWRVSVGADYKWNDQWTLKGGLAYDQTPVKSATTRTVRLPDNDRIWLALGAQMRVGQSGRLDLGYAHLFIKDADINHTRSQQAPGFTVPTPAPGTATTVTGTYEGSVDILSVQYSMSF
ncbi:MAG TPA: outer membrane protein transport protein [Burkholderiales bacterium]|jgi:long-chain fatty acid transport protein|nr:outer membrane protein transport protein [Burkholderiales bacterium]